MGERGGLPEGPGGDGTGGAEEAGPGEAGAGEPGPGGAGAGETAPAAGRAAGFRHGTVQGLL